MTLSKADAKPYSYDEACQAVAYHGAPACPCPDDDRLVATASALENQQKLVEALNQELADLRADLHYAIRSRDFWQGKVLAVAEAQREESLKSVYFRLKGALPPGVAQQALNKVIDEERLSPLVTAKLT